MDFILQTKLATPVIRDRLVARPRLFQLLENGLLKCGEFQRKLTLVAAPAGYGKTTLIAGWLSTEAFAYAWLSLDETDNDPSRFLAYLVTALLPLGVGSAARQALQSPQPPPPEVIVSILLNEIKNAPQGFILVLDDYHAIHTSRIHKIVTFFLEHQPAIVHLILMTREDPLLPVPRMRVRDQVLEIRQDDLRFTFPETHDFLCRLMRLDLTEEDVTLLDQRTEGWIAGLQLAALALQGFIHRAGKNPRDFIEAFSGSHRFIIDYLVSEVFKQQTREIQEFLLKTAILERMTGSLCDVVTGRGDSNELLENLEQANLFIIPLDQTHTWYRYHHLFVEFLRHQLREHVPTSYQQLHHTASSWFEAQGLIVEAIEHSLVACDWKHTGEMIHTLKDQMLRQGEIATLLTWYGKLPDEMVRSKPELCLGYAWPLLLSSQLDKAESLLASAEPAVVPGSEMQGDFYAERAYLARSRGDYATVISASEQALPLLSQTNRAARGTLAVNLGIAYWHQGQLGETEKIMSDVLQIGSQTGNMYAVLTARFFRIRALATRGQLRQVELHYLNLIHASGQTPITALAHYDLCILYWEWNRLDEAQKHLQFGLEISAQTGNAEFLSSGYILQAFLYLAHRNPAAAWEEAARAYELARGFSTAVLARNEALHVRIALALGDIDLAAHWARQMQAGADAHPLYRFLDLTHPLLLIAQGKKEEARNLLAPCCKAARENDWGYALVAALILQTLAAQAVDPGVDFLSEALRLAQAEGYLRTFLDAGAGLVPYLQEAARRGIHPLYVGQILEGIKPIPPRNTPSLVEALSEREVEVLRLIATGLSNREIALQLVISPGTAKTHIHNICGKLAVHNRTEAAARARDLNLV